MTETTTEINLLNQDKTIPVKIYEEDNEIFNITRSNAERLCIKSKIDPLDSYDACESILFNNKLPPPTEINVGKVQPPLPPDGGWGWVIVFGSFVCMALVDGMCLSYGIFLSELEETFKASKMKMSLAGSLLTGCYLLMGPITSALDNQFGPQVIIIVGSAISTLAIFLSAFIYDFDLFIVVFGILGGIGYGLIFLPAATVVSLWFHKRRATATGIAVCGSGIGSALYGIVAPYLIKHFTWRGCIILLAAVNFHCALAGALFRPLTLSDYVRKIAAKDPLIKKVTLTKAEEVHPAKMKAKSGNLHNTIKAWKQRRQVHRARQCSVFDATLQNKEQARAISTGSLNGKMLSIDNQLITIPQDYPDKPMLSNEAINHIVQSYFATMQQDAAKGSRIRSQSSLYHSFGGAASGGILVHSQGSIHRNNQVNLIEPAVGSINFTSPTSQHQSYFSSMISLAPAVNAGHVINYDTKADIMQKLQQEVARPIKKKDIFYSGSMVHLPEFVTNQEDVRSYIRSVTNIVEEADTKNAIFSAFTKLFDVSILKSYTFLLLAISSFFAMLGFFIPFQYLKDNAQHIGYSPEWSSFLLSIIGVTNTVGRIISGILSDQPWANCLWINNVALIVAGGSTMLIPFCHSYELLALYATVFGLFIAAFVSLRTILIVELIGLERLTNAYGFLLLFQGFAIVIGPPMFGSFYDAMKVYDYTFYLGGSCLVFSGLLCLPLRKIAYYEKKRVENLKRKNYPNQQTKSPEIPIFQDDEDDDEEEEEEKKRSRKRH